MKKLALVIVMLIVAVCFTSQAFAEPIDMSDVFDKAPEIKEGALYSFDDAKIKVSTSFDLVNYGDMALELGAIAEDNEAFLAVSYHVVNLKEDKKITTWILDLIDISVAVGYGLKEIGGDNEGDLLIGLTLLKWKI